MLGHGLYCLWDASEIPEGRARKGAITCCDECKRQYANYRRRVCAQVRCRLCGREDGEPRNSSLCSWSTGVFVGSFQRSESNLGKNPG